MKTGIKRFVLGVAAAAVLVGGMAACGGMRGPGPWGHSHWGSSWSEADAAEHRAKMVKRVSKKLDLNAEQKVKLEALADAMGEQRKALRGEGDPRAEPNAVIAGNTFDRDKAQRLVDQKISAVQAQSPNVLDKMAEFYDSLNPEQQQKVRDQMNRRMGYGR